MADNQKGTLRYAMTQVNPTQPASGAGVIFTVQFRGKAAGETAFKLAPVEMADRQGQMLPVTVQSGTLRVVSQPSTKIPVPTSQLHGGGHCSSRAHCRRRPHRCAGSDGSAPRPRFRADCHALAARCCPP